MLTNVEIQNFKSVRDLKFDAKRVNLFIGEPNTGKTNILEALALLSEGVHGPAEFKEVFRFRSVAELFYRPASGNSHHGRHIRRWLLLSFDGQQFQFVARMGTTGEDRNSVTASTNWKSSGMG